MNIFPNNKSLNSPPPPPEFTNDNNPQPVNAAADSRSNPNSYKSFNVNVPPPPTVKTEINSVETSPYPSFTPNEPSQASEESFYDPSGVIPNPAFINQDYPKQTQTQTRIQPEAKPSSDIMVLKPTMISLLTKGLYLGFLIIIGDLIVNLFVNNAFISTIPFLVNLFTFLFLFFIVVCMGIILYLYLQLRSTSYEIKPGIIFFHYGVLRKKSRYINLEGINAIFVSTNVLERWLGYGSVFIAGGTLVSNIRLQDVAEPDMVANHLRHMLMLE